MLTKSWYVGDHSSLSDKGSWRNNVFSVTLAGMCLVVQFLAKAGRIGYRAPGRSTELQSESPMALCGSNAADELSSLQGSPLGR